MIDKIRKMYRRRSERRRASAAAWRSMSMGREDLFYAESFRRGTW